MIINEQYKLSRLREVVKEINKLEVERRKLKEELGLI